MGSGLCRPVEPATITIRPNGHGEVAFGAMQAGLDLAYSTSMASLTWAGCGTGDFFNSLLVQFRQQYCAALLRRLRRLGHPSGPSSAARGQGINPAGLVAPLQIRTAIRIADVKQRRRR